MSSRYGQPTRARDVLRHIAIIGGTGDPPGRLVDAVRWARDVKYAGRTPTYADYAKASGWHEGGPGDLLRKALVEVGCDVR